MNIPALTRRALTTAVAGLLAAGAAGCKSKSSYSEILKHPSPEMFSTKDRWVDAEGDYAYMRNTNYRGFWDDLSREIYIDNPSRLSPYPIIDLSGSPR